MTQDKIPHQRHIAPKKSRHSSLKVTGHGAGGCAEIPEFLDGSFACRPLTMPTQRSSGGRGRHKHPHYPDLHHRHGYEHEAARQNSPRKKGPF